MYRLGLKPRSEQFVGRNDVKKKKNSDETFIRRRKECLCVGERLFINYNIHIIYHIIIVHDDGGFYAWEDGRVKGGVGDPPRRTPFHSEQ